MAGIKGHGKIQTGYRIPRELVKWVQEQATANGVDATAIVVAVLRRASGVPDTLQADLEAQALQEARELAARWKEPILTTAPFGSRPLEMTRRRPAIGGKRKGQSTALRQALADRQPIAPQVQTKVLEVCRCGHLETSHWARGCIAGCTCRAFHKGRGKT